MSPEAGNGVWVAYYLDGSMVVPFGTEIEALRYAVNASMQVMFLEFGKSVQEAMKK